MSTTYLEIEDKYSPSNDNNDIIVSVNIGNGQSGAYLVFLDQALKGANQTSVIGKRNDIVGKRTIISATITDVLEETNWTSVTVTITQGANTKVYGPYSKQAAQNLDTVCYIIKISNTNE